MKTSPTESRPGLDVIWHSLRRLFDLFSPRERWQFLLLVPLLLVGSALEVVGIGILPAFLAAALKPDALAAVPVVGPWLQEMGSQDPSWLITLGIIGVAGVLLLKNCYQLLQTYAVMRYCKNRQVTLGVRLFSAYQRAPLEFLFGRNNAEIVRNLNSDVQMVCNSVLVACADIITNAITACGVLALLFFADPFVAAMVLGVGLVVAALYYFVLNRQVARMGTTAFAARRDLVRDLNEALYSVRETRVLNLEPFQAGKVKRAMQSTADAQRLQQLLSAVSTPLLEIAAVAMMAGVVLLLLRGSEDLSAIVPILSLFGIALVRLRGYTSVLLSRWNALHFRLPSVNAIVDDIVHLEAEEAARAVKDSEKLPFTFESEIVLKDVSYSYPNAETPAIKHVSMTVQRGTTLGIVGATGSGKTTLVDLLLGLLRPDAGLIRIDNTPIERIRSLRDHVGYVPQFIHLFDDTIRNNIAAGVKASKIDDQQVWHALEQAQIADFVRKQPLGLAMTIGENGVRLSGGQRQRFGIARALFRDPELLVFDEGTSALDHETEDALMKAIERLQGTKTLILIAHRLQTLISADLIVRIQEGKIKEVVDVAATTRT